MKCFDEKFEDTKGVIRSRISKTKKEIIYNGRQKRTTQKAILYICKSYEFQPCSWLGLLDVTLCNKVCQ